MGKPVQTPMPVTRLIGLNLQSQGVLCLTRKSVFHLKTRHILPEVYPSVANTFSCQLQCIAFVQTNVEDFKEVPVLGKWS